MVELNYEQTLQVLRRNFGSAVGSDLWGRVVDAVVPRHNRDVERQR
jgi:hypothetical protein